MNSVYITSISWSLLLSNMEVPLNRRPSLSRWTFIKLTATVAAGVGGCFFFLLVDLKENISRQHIIGGFIR
jgi:hypothetical protein